MSYNMTLLFLLELRRGLDLFRRHALQSVLDCRTCKVNGFRQGAHACLKLKWRCCRICLSRVDKLCARLW